MFSSKFRKHDGETRETRYQDLRTTGKYARSGKIRKKHGSWITSARSEIDSVGVRPETREKLGCFRPIGHSAVPFMVSSPPPPSSQGQRLIYGIESSRGRRGIGGLLIRHLSNSGTFRASYDTPVWPPAGIASILRRNSAACRLAEAPFASLPPGPFLHPLRSSCVNLERDCSIARAESRFWLDHKGALSVQWDFLVDSGRFVRSDDVPDMIVHYT